MDKVNSGTQECNAKMLMNVLRAPHPVALTQSARTCVGVFPLESTFLLECPHQEMMALPSSV
ncbi:hypothetical protein SUZIE_113950 [Sciurus carolinensis]|uniref:Uncharacterized protein n=1 Tax=Sciurus carolinensis TaxID=30640 RepID=A0AA41MGP3_SCICA|nr:hypothetical protein [Sciurus carolinensis]